MKAIIFNSGLGKRMEELTKNCHKAMVSLDNGETIFERQLRILKENGINDIIITTGPFEEQLIEVTKQEEFNGLNFIFVQNSKYDQTNYIYSMYLAHEYLDDDMIFLHGDLVFNSELLKEVLENPEKSLCLINEFKKLPEKDFKGRVVNGILKEVSINIFDSDCYAFQPLYKLSKNDVLKWVKQVEKFIIEGNDKVYAENALNEILNDMTIKAVSYSKHYIDEVDTKEDLTRVSREITEFEKVNITSIKL
ncbi:MAG TPA: NTP transferase domain-containing protein [Gallicola sp.]|nr:NTP transferase domain-containing protein [Gallicola sp.]